MKSTFSLHQLQQRVLEDSYHRLFQNPPNDLNRIPNLYARMFYVRMNLVGLLGGKPL